jgi:hypothetical protein
VSGPAGAEAANTASGTGAIGDVRTIAVLVLSTPPDAVVLAEINTATSLGEFHFSTSDPLPFARAFINYEADGAGFNQDLSGEAAVVFEQVSTSTLTQISLQLEAPEPGGGFISSGYSILLAAGFAGDVSFDLSRFEGDLRHVGRAFVVVDVHSPPSGDVRIGRLVAVPETTTAVLVGFGLIGIVGFTKREG